MLRLIRRHLSACPYPRNAIGDAAARIHVYGTLGGERIRKALDLTSWEAARSLSAMGECRPDRRRQARHRSAVSDAVSKFLADSVARHLRSTTIRRYRDILEKKLVAFTESKGLRYVKAARHRRAARVPGGVDIHAGVVAQAAARRPRVLQLRISLRIDRRESGYRASGLRRLFSSQPCLSPRPSSIES